MERSPLQAFVNDKLTANGSSIYPSNTHHDIELQILREADGYLETVWFRVPPMLPSPYWSIWRFLESIKASPKDQYNVVGIACNWRQANGVWFRGGDWAGFVASVAALVEKHAPTQPQ